MLVRVLSSAQSWAATLRFLLKQSKLLGEQRLGALMAGLKLSLLLVGQCSAVRILSQEYGGIIVQVLFLLCGSSEERRASPASGLLKQATG